ncbi:hypothetical protein GALMADRAFT_791703 [Galerina marginata CBS 339.88]|uniref:Uncharacterized protein n=1 Tax=Galerina marginata (strain CBS 339.88) TaxID=685588 RepID=A0A067SXU4_GALM3|nr:hypothetical protein GALMADRAFT_791703 [Galerina marginata CBS 339.88]
MAQITDLPTELILQILQDDLILAADLYAVGVASKRLNLIAIPLLLKAQGVSNPEDSISLSFDHGSLHPSQRYPGLSRMTSTINQQEKNIPVEAAIMVAFSISSIREMKCTFPQSFTDLRILLHHIERLAGLLSRLESVKSMTFYFIGDHRHRHLSLNPLSANPVPFADIFSDIVHSLTLKSCEKFVLYNQSHRLQGQWEFGVDLDEQTETYNEVGGSFGNSASTSPSINLPNETGKTKSVSNLLRWTWARFENVVLSHFTRSSKFKLLSISTKSNPLYPSFHPSVLDHRASGTLRALYIQTPFVLLPRCLPAIRNIIHTSASTLTSLTLSYIIFDEHLFDSCLSSLFLDRHNAITQLSILHCRQISPKAFLAFLGCFNDRLEYLELDREMGAITGSEDLPRLFFPKLHTLKAPLDWVAHILKMSLPNIFAMTIQCRLGSTVYFMYDIFRPHLDSVLKPVHSSWTWPLRHNPVTKVEITINSKLDRKRPWQMEDGVISVPAHWHLISSLELSNANPPANPTEAGAMVQWVTTLFPAVEQVTLPFPHIPSGTMSIPEYKCYQEKAANEGVALLRIALKKSWIGFPDAPPHAWKRLVVGPWRFSFDLDPEQV